MRSPPVLRLLPLLMLLTACDGASTSSVSSAAALPPGAAEDPAPAPVQPPPAEVVAAAPANTPPAGPTPRPPHPAPAELWSNYLNPRAGSVLDLQPFRQDSRSTVTLADGSHAEAILINPAPAVGAWYVLYLGQGNNRRAFHLELPDGDRHVLRLAADHATGPVIDGPRPKRCDLWAGATPSPLDAARAGGQTYAPLCDGRLYLRNRTEGRKTTLEWTTDFLRDHVWGGEELTVFVRSTFFQDANLSSSELNAGQGGVKRIHGAPAAPLVDPAVAAEELVARDLGLSMEGVKDQRVRVGQWYLASGNPGVYVSTLQPRLVAREVAVAQQGRVNSLDEVEARAMAYQVAFDLDRFNVAFTLGTDHPRVDWSDRVPSVAVDPKLPGPDGFATLDPLVRTGRVPPWRLYGITGTFTGGFKRSHGAFKRTTLATTNHGSHYGFIEEGVVQSKLQPGLATFLVTRGGDVAMRTWQEADNAGLQEIRYARQNGVAIIEPDPTGGLPLPGPYVKAWGDGNWSGSQDGKLRTVRASLCLQDGEAGRFLLYGYFSGATPSSMARVLQAYHCRYAMLLDMNALEHTYLALYTGQGSDIAVEHLITGMDVLDKAKGEQVLPRFLAFSDNRDFFYLVRRGAP